MIQSDLCSLKISPTKRGVDWRGAREVGGWLGHYFGNLVRDVVG